MDIRSLPAKRNGTIDFFKFVFAVLVALFHMSQLFNTENRIFFESGRIAVEFFFIVSGYLLVEKAEKSSHSRDIFSENVRMLKGKALRIFPYVFIAVITGIIFYMIRNPSPSTGEFIYSLTEIYAMESLGFHGFYVTGVIWYLTVLFVVSFLVYPLLLRKKEVFTKYIGPLSAIIILGNIAYASGNLKEPGAWWGITTKGMLRGYADMALGCTAYEIAAYFNRDHSVSRSVAGILEIAGYVVTIGFAVFHPESDHHDFMIIPLILLSVSLSFSNKSILAQVFNHPVFNRLGLFSMSIYLNHVYVVMLFRRGAFSEVSVAGRVALCSCIIAAVSLLNYYLGRLLSKRINTVPRMICVTMLYAFCILVIQFVIR